MKVAVRIAGGGGLDHRNPGVNLVQIVPVSGAASQFKLPDSSLSSYLNGYIQPNGRIDFKTTVPQGRKGLLTFEQSVREFLGLSKSPYTNTDANRVLFSLNDFYTKSLGQPNERKLLEIHDRILFSFLKELELPRHKDTKFNVDSRKEIDYKAFFDAYDRRDEGRKASYSVLQAFMKRKDDGEYTHTYTNALSTILGETFNFRSWVTAGFWSHCIADMQGAVIYRGKYGLAREGVNDYETKSYFAKAKADWVEKITNLNIGTSVVFLSGYAGPITEHKYSDGEVYKSGVGHAFAIRFFKASNSELWASVNNFGLGEVGERPVDSALRPVGSTDRTRVGPVLVSFGGGFPLEGFVNQLFEWLITPREPYEFQAEFKTMISDAFARGRGMTYLGASTVPDDFKGLLNPAFYSKEMVGDYCVPSCINADLKQQVGLFVAQHHNGLALEKQNAVGKIIYQAMRHAILIGLKDSVEFYANEKDPGLIGQVNKRLGRLEEKIKSFRAEDMRLIPEPFQNYIQGIREFVPVVETKPEIVPYEFKEGCCGCVIS